MLARIRKAKEQEGFTLIELLVVMIIIGILAAIAIPVFLSQRAKAQDSAAKADVSTLGKEVATHFVDSAVAPGVAIVGGRYVLDLDGAGAGTATRDLGKVSPNVTLTSANFNATTPSTSWCIEVNNANGDQKIWKYSAKGGLATGACATGTDF